MTVIARAVVNPRAGGLVRRGAVEVVGLLRARLEALGHRLERVEVDTDVRAAVHRAIGDEAFDVLFVLAGDGTVGTAAARLLDTGVALAVVPMGTFNLLARDLDVPAELGDALAALAAGAPEAIDVAWVNEHLFLSACAFGLAADACAVREGVRDADLFAWPDVLFDVAKRLADARPIVMRVDDGRRVVRWRSHAAFVSNGPFRRSGSLLMRRDSLASGRLALYAQRQPSLLHAVRTLVHARLGGFWRSEVVAEDLVSLTIATRPATVLATIDGELEELTSPLVFRVQQQALRVWRPAATTAADLNPESVPDAPPSARARDDGSA